jgi:hypothetical protein
LGDNKEKKGLIIMQVEIKSLITTKLNNYSGTLNVLQPEADITTVLTTNEQATGIQPKIEDTDVIIHVPVTNDSFVPSQAKLPVTHLATITPPFASIHTFTIPSVSSDTPIVPLSLEIKCTSTSGESVVITEDVDPLNGGILVSPSPVFVTGTLNYETGDISIELTEDFDTAIDIEVDYAYYALVTLFPKSTPSPQYVMVKLNYSELKAYMERTERQETRLVDSMTGVI